MIRVADFVVSYICDVLGVRDVFSLSGGGIMFLSDALVQNPKMNVICNHHEQASAMALEAYARVSGKIGVGFFTTGPGATNAITGLAGAWLDSVPCLFVSGQAKKRETVQNSKVKNLRQFGVQEVNIIPIVKSLTKLAITLNDPKDVKYELERLSYYAIAGRPGPVWLDIPLDVQGALVDPKNLRSFQGKKKLTKPKRENISEFLDLLAKAQRPVILVGQGVRIASAINELKEFAEKRKIPVVSTYLGIDSIDNNNRIYVGPVGIKGSRAGNLALQNADLVLAIGTSLHVGTIGYEYGFWGRAAKKVVVDIDEIAHKKKTIKIDLFVKADAKDFLQIVNGKTGKGKNENWLNICLDWKKRFPVCLPEYENISNEINMYYFVERLNKKMKNNTVVVSDAGSAYYVVSQAIKIGSNQRYITSGALATMGYTIPACIGASLASKNPIIGITGDGSFQLNLQELQTIIHNNLPIKFFVLNNKGYLSIRTTQERFFNSRYTGESSSSGVSFPDLKKITEAYGITYIKMENNGDLDTVIEKTLAFEGPIICEVLCLERQEIIPTVASEKRADGSMVSKPLEDMYPFLSREELESIMLIPPVRHGKKEG